jgi:hypothetical protein
VPLAQRSQVFLSVGVPHLLSQELFLRRFEASLRARGLAPWTLGRGEYDYRNPMRAIREAMLSCRGAAIIGLGRRFSPVSIDRFGSPRAERKKGTWTATPWNQLEAGMAYQLGLPLLILKDRAIIAEGILDQAISGFLVFEFDLEAEAKGLSQQLRATIARWSHDVVRAKSTFDAFPDDT